MRFLLCAAPLLVLCQCQSALLGRADGIDPNPFQVLEQQAGPENRDPARIKVPVLRSAVLEKRWGKPRLLVGPNGGYALRYENPRRPGTHLTIFGSARKYPTAGPFAPPYTDLGADAGSGTFSPREVAQSWKSTLIAGREVRYCIAEAGSEDDPVQYTTETFRLTAPDGRTASYRLRCAQADDSADIVDLLKSAAF